MESLDFGFINKQLKKLIDTILGRLKQEQSDRIAKGLPLLSELWLLAADNNYNAARVLVVKDYNYSAPAKVIARSTLDLVFTACLVFSAPTKYVPLYWRSGWRERFERLTLEKQSEFMQESGSEWLKEFEQFVDKDAEIIGLTYQEREAYDLMTYYPTPPQILSKKIKYSFYKDLDQLTFEFLTKLDEEYYRPLSRLVHLSDPGLALHVGPLLKDFPLEQQEILKSEPLIISMLALLCLLSEIVTAFDYIELKPKLKELWTYLALSVPLHKELYQIKYQKTL